MRLSSAGNQPAGYPASPSEYLKPRGLLSDGQAVASLKYSRPVKTSLGRRGGWRGVCGDTEACAESAQQGLSAEKMPNQEKSPHLTPQISLTSPFVSFNNLGEPGPPQPSRSPTHPGSLALGKDQRNSKDMTGGPSVENLSPSDTQNSTSSSRKAFFLSCKDSWERKCVETPTRHCEWFFPTGRVAASGTWPPESGKQDLYLVGCSSKGESHWQL